MLARAMPRADETVDRRGQMCLARDKLARAHLLQVEELVFLVVEELEFIVQQRVNLALHGHLGFCRRCGLRGHRDRQTGGRARLLRHQSAA